MADRRVVLFYSGGDWADASVRDLEVPAELDLNSARQEYDREEKYPGGHWIGPFSDWLVKNKGCKEANLEGEED